VTLEQAEQSYFLTLLTIKSMDMVGRQ
jgi:hypothetical protein